jgi:hypothetical protein
MKISDLNKIDGLLNICAAASAASLDFFISSSATEPTERMRFLGAMMHHPLIAFSQHSAGSYLCPKAADNSLSHHTSHISASADFGMTPQIALGRQLPVTTGRKRPKAAFRECPKSATSGRSVL